MSVFNVSQTESTALNAVERNTSGDRLNENVPNTIAVIGQASLVTTTITSRNNGINNNSVSANSGVNNINIGRGVSGSVSGGGGFQSDLCSDSEEDCERTAAKKLAVNKWLTNYEDVSTKINTNFQ